MKSDFSYVFDKENFKILNQISSSRTSKVFLGLESGSNQLVAIKVMSPTMLPGEKSMAKFEELLVQRYKANHENISRLIANGRCKVSGLQDSCYFVSEYVEGTSLSSRIKGLSEEPLVFREVLDLLLQLLSALEALHAAHVPAYSLNPKNILLDDKHRLRLPAFSYVSSSQWVQDAGNYSIISGVDYRYIAPEMVTPGTLVAGDLLTDIYLFGLIAFELSCGEVPFDANRETLMQLHLHESPPNILSESGLPKWFEELVHSCLEKKPSKRPTLEQIKTTIIQHMDAAVEDELSLLPLYTKRNLHILFVEDNKLDQLSFARFAKSMRYPFSYAIARNIAKAKEMLQRETYDVVVSDFMLPDGTGVDIVKAAKPIPTIVVTGAGREDVAARALRAGAFDYISKDIMHKHLVELPHAVSKAYEFGKAIQERDKFVQRVNELEKQSHSALAKIALTDEFETLITTSQAYLHGMSSLVDNKEALLAKLHELDALWTKGLESMREVYSHQEPEAALIDATEIDGSVNEVIELLSVSQNLSNISFTVRSTVEGGFKLNLGKIKFKQIVLHLVRNACEALASSKGQIAINLSPKKSFNQDVIADPWLIVTVEDSGLGIESEVLNTLFQPFVTTKRETGHLGIGLSIVNDLVREAGGYLFAKNPSYGGARIEIYLPFAEVQSTAQSSEHSRDIPFAQVQDTGLQQTTVFLAETNQQTTEMLRSVFAAKGLELKTLNSLEESLAVLAQKPSRETPILIVSENLPYLNRITSYAREKKYNLPIIQLCRTVANLSEDCFRQNKQQYLVQKPLRAEHILKVLNHCLHKES